LAPPAPWGTWQAAQSPPPGASEWDVLVTVAPAMPAKANTMAAAASMQSVFLIFVTPLSFQRVEGSIVPLENNQVIRCEQLPDVFPYFWYEPLICFATSLRRGAKQFCFVTLVYYQPVRAFSTSKRPLNQSY
jgi:hypothetical protein